ncbi:hypothetical protein K488DRAFT_88371 [Vararia minispora EC-137]|uniref:Uncharacterized protein n=1 Tax=Vararia minispora EC-137 TaxID=1314806 RepID=A0ACB8QDZ7_9AGAM|nr:hypothetical protein K488DRAFT_88371 [Vararia minispora EC-137]
MAGNLDFKERFMHIHSLWVDSDVLHAPYHPTLSAYNLPNLSHVAMPFTLFTAMALSKQIMPCVGLSLVLIGGVRELRNSLREIQSVSVDANGPESPLLAAVTHLQLMTIAIGPTNPLIHFTNLTHLAMPYFGVLGIDAPLNRLKMLVFVVHTSSSRNVHWDCRQRVTRARMKGRLGLFFVEEMDSRFKKRWIQTVRGEFPSVWERARTQTALLEEIFETAGGDWSVVEECWKERFVVCVLTVS